MDLDRFFSDKNLALYRLLASSTDVDQRRTILKQLADETARLKRELRRPQFGEKATAGETPPCLNCGPLGTANP